MGDDGWRRAFSQASKGGLAGEYVSSDKFWIKSITKQLSVVVRFDMRVFIGQNS